MPRQIDRPMLLRVLVAILITVIASGPNWCCCNVAALAQQCQRFSAQILAFSASADVNEYNPAPASPAPLPCPKCLARGQASSMDAPGINDRRDQQDLSSGPLAKSCCKSPQGGESNTDESNCHCQHDSAFVSGNTAGDEQRTNDSTSPTGDWPQPVDISKWRFSFDCRPDVEKSLELSTSKLWGRQLLRAYQILRC